MTRRLIDYREVVGDRKIDEIFQRGSKIRNAHIVMINSTSRGGGVAEILRSLIPLANDSGPNVGWRTLAGHPDFFRVTKRIHNALQGDDIDLTEKKKRVYEGVNEEFSRYTHLDHDLVVIHDPQPLPLITYYDRTQPWIWRCHIDLSEPNQEVWNYLEKFVIPYDHEVYQLDKFARTPGEYTVIYPSIDPLSTKNVDIGEKTVKKYLEKVGISPKDSRPLIVQVSRFDPWKDPLGVIKVFDRIKEEIDATLVLVGAFAEDDPQAEGVYEGVLHETKNREDIILAPNIHDIAVNAVQRAADVVLQKSLREGFGLTVTEAMWKKTPVIGSNVGGIPKQIEDGETGYLVDPKDTQEVADKTLDVLLSDREKIEEMGEKGRKRVTENFLITRQIDDWLDLWGKTLG